MVRVVTREGEPGAGLQLELRGTDWEVKTTDSGGRAVFESVRPDAYRLFVRDPDFVWSETEVVLGDGEYRRLTLYEPPGWTACATLQDSRGRPVPFARVRVRARGEYVRVVNGVQDLAFFTDANGRIELPQMHHAPVTLAFRYGSREAEVEIEEWQPTVAVRLPPPQ